VLLYSGLHPRHDDVLDLLSVSHEDGKPVKTVLQHWHKDSTIGFTEYLFNITSAHEGIVRVSSPLFQGTSNVY